MMLNPSVNFELKINAPLQTLSIGTQKCNNTDDDDADRDMIPMCRPCFTGDKMTKSNYLKANEYDQNRP